MGTPKTQAKNKARRAGRCFNHAVSALILTLLD
jgi:hypothetical protein